MTEIEVLRGSLLEQDVDFIVNAANTLMRGGGGIDGAIHQRAGHKLLLELQRVAPKGCETGEVVVTAAHELPHKGIIHTPGPIWRGGGSNEAVLLANCYRNSLIAAHSRNAESIGFCSISTGVYGFPIDEAASIALDTIKEWLSLNPSTTLRRIVFAMRGEPEFLAFEQALKDMSGN